MKDVTVFKNEDLGSVRVAGTKEQPLFCLKDVCEVLGIETIGMLKQTLFKSLAMMSIKSTPSLII